MTIGNSLWIGVSGLQAHGEAISTVGDNIANVSTIGFKRSRAGFNDILGGQMVSTGNMQQRTGGGVFLGGNQSMWEQGTITQTGNPLDVGISGNGMFVVSGKFEGRDGQAYTRDGRFRLDNSGTLVDAHGMKVQGYPITNGTRGSSYGDLNLAGRHSPAIATTTAGMTLNLNPTESEYPTSITIYDSLGVAHQAQVTFTKSTANPNEWAWSATVDGGEVSGGVAGTPVTIGGGTLTFNTDGDLTNPTGHTANVSFNSGATAGQAVAFDFSNTTQEEVGHGVQSVDVNGRTGGSLTDVRITADGTVEGIFDNGQTYSLAQLAIADFQANEGLQRLGSSLYAATRDSGQAVIDVAGNNGRGALVSGALEQSNVDLSTELVQLIAYQRAFQANSKTVTTADEMMMEVTNLKR